MINKLAKELTQYIEKKGLICQSDYEIYQYGFIMGLEMSSCFLCGMALSLYLNVFVEFLIVTMVFASLRSFSGGWHMKSFLGCLVCSNIVVIGIIILNRFWTLPLHISCITSLLGTIVIYIIAPISHVNRIIERSEVKKFKRKLCKIIGGMMIGILILSGLTAIYYVSLIAMSIIGVLIPAIIGKLEFSLKN